MNDRHVYILRDDRQRVLYVGASGNPTMRMRRHIDRPWGHEIASMEVIPCSTSEAATDLERKMIRETRPKYNVAWTDRESARRGTRQRQLLDILRREGPMTQVQLEHYCRDNGIDNSKSFCGTTVRRLVEKGLVEVVDEVPSIKGRWKTARVFGAAA